MDLSTAVTDKIETLNNMKKLRTDMPAAFFCGVIFAACMNAACECQAGWGRPGKTK